jgi:hypothetical protein
MAGYDPIAYTYDADYHCPACAIARFGSDNGRWPAMNATDYEGNGLGVIAPWDCWWQGTGETEILGCSDCGTEIDRYEIDPNETDDN